MNKKTNYMRNITKKLEAKRSIKENNKCKL